VSILFEPTDFLGMKLKNRFVRSATAENMAGPDGTVTDELLSLYTSLAEGQIGLIITSAVFPRRNWFPAPVPGLLFLDDDGVIPGLKKLVQSAHSRGSAIIMQMVPPAVIGEEAVGPSDLKEEAGLPSYRGMTLQEMEDSAGAFGEAARRAREAGFDAVQLHVCHGDTLSRFISPFFNRRTDDYGGSPENRARYLIDVTEAIKD
jgi:2,4-dienoyl-CoA reductase-like NADH-dependent reductase (Old Yellow Enzyme family)